MGGTVAPIRGLCVCRADGHDGPLLNTSGLVELLGLSAVAGSVCEFIVDALVNYKLNCGFTFRSTAVHGGAIPKFIMVGAVSFGIYYLMMWAGRRWTSLHYLINQMAATATVLLWGLAANGLWTFKSEQRGSV